MGNHLIVVHDADLAILDMIQECLCDEGYHIAASAAYQDAFEQIKLSRPTLAIIELLCTNPTSGVTLLNNMRSDPLTKNIPVIVTSSDSTLLHNCEAFLSAQDYAMLQKPFDIDDLFTIMDRMIHTHAPFETGLAIECGGSEICY